MKYSVLFCTEATRGDQVESDSPEHALEIGLNYELRRYGPVLERKHVLVIDENGTVTASEISIDDLKR